MQSSLKKSLYLGLAALSFASVASVTANSSNANAAKKHAAAKKVTYKTTNKKLDQSVVFKSTGKNAVYNKPVGKRSVKASLSDMKSKANSKSTNDLFMAYQEGHTSKGVHYYKVVSFDQKVRGFVYNKGVAKVDNSQDVAQPSNTTGYLTTTNRFFNQAYGVQFHNNNLKKEYNGMNIAADQFTVSKAVKVNNDQTYYYVTDKNNQLINGWVNSVYFSNTITPAAQKNLDAQKAVHVKVVDKNNAGALVSSFDVQPNGGSYRGKDTNYNQQDFKTAVENQLINTGYSWDSVQSNDDSKAPSMDQPRQGDNVTVFVTKNNNSNVNATFNLQGLSLVASGAYYGNPVSLNGATLNALTDAQQKELSGYANDEFNINSVINDIFADGKAWNTINANNTTYVFDKDATLAAFNQEAKDLGHKVTFADVNKTQLPVYYRVKTNNSSDQNKPSQFDQGKFVPNGGSAQNTVTTQSSDQDKVSAAVKSFNTDSKGNLSDALRASTYSTTNDLLAGMKKANNVQNNGDLLNAVQKDVLSKALTSDVNNALADNVTDASHTTKDGSGALNHFNVQAFNGDTTSKSTLINALKGTKLDAGTIKGLVDGNSSLGNVQSGDNYNNLKAVVDDKSFTLD
ncbi:hypothetical protein [Apilactobacillus micheneri]|uniref:hypothetical protein n=1 Tax=Apilactobacillus micheneri TaxID=1899430 RepID=UPI000D50C9C6|nr:hypothetical protein [Apilactobacillus micheneri]GAY79482.1 S-layer protein [Apilactobacillus micheneri]